MKKYIILVCSLCISLDIWAQEPVKELEMEFAPRIINEPAFVIEWIKEAFVTDDTSALDREIEYFPFSMTGANRKLANVSYTPSFYGVPMETVWANFRDGDLFELHFLLHLKDITQLMALVDAMGMPENWSRQEIEAGHYDILCWFANGVDIVIGRSHYSKANPKVPFEKKNSLFKVCITNAKPGELPGPEPLEP